MPCPPMRWLAALLIACALPLAAVAAPPTDGMDQSLLKPHLVRVAPGRRLNFHCVGQGAPTVLFDQGGEGMIFNWARVQPAITRLTRTCFYDRGGFGWSDPPRYPVTAITVTDDLHTLLRAAGVTGKVVLVGHSIGGFYATMYADRFPDQVAGMVLVEPGFNAQDFVQTGERWEHDQANVRRGEGELRRCADFARSHLLTAANLAQHRCYELPKEATTPAERAYALHAITGPNWYEGENDQSQNYISADHELSVSKQQERQAARSFGDIPLVVLTGVAEGDDWLTDAENAAFLVRWRAGHIDLAKRSTRGRHVDVPNAGHFIQLDQPQPVIAAIEEVVQAARTADR